MCFPVLSPCPAAATRRCHSIYKGFAQCLMALGDSLTDSARKDEDTHEIYSICRSACGHTHVVPHYTHTQTLLKNPEALSHINRKSADFEIYFSKPHRAVIGIFCYFETEGLEIRQKLSRDSSHCLYSLCKAFRKKSSTSILHSSKSSCYLISIGHVQAVHLYNTTDRRPGSLIPHSGPAHML